MGRVRQVLGKVPIFNTIWSFVDHLVVIYLFAGGVLGAAMLTLWAWLENHLPYWGIALLFLCAFVVVEAAISFGIDLYRKAKAARLDHQKVGNDLTSLSDDLSRWITDRVRERAQIPIPPVNIAENAVAAHAEWERQRREGRILLQGIAERYGARIMQAVILMKKLDISVPFHLSSLGEHNIAGFASFIGAVGRLIRDDNISAAQSLGTDTQWELSNLFN